MVKRRKIRRKRLPAPIAVAQEIPLLLQRMGGTPFKAELASLWSNWADILGAELAAMALPLGARDDTLLIGAEDAVLIQELHFLAADILERINSHLKCGSFQKVKVLLATEGRNCPEPEKIAHSEASHESAGADAAPPVGHLSGKFLSSMDPDSPVARCYARFVRRRF